MATNNSNDIIIYQSPDGTTKLDVRLERGGLVDSLISRVTREI